MQWCKRKEMGFAETLLVWLSIRPGLRAKTPRPLPPKAMIKGAEGGWRRQRLPSFRSHAWLRSFSLRLHHFSTIIPLLWYISLFCAISIALLRRPCRQHACQPHW